MKKSITAVLLALTILFCAACGEKETEPVSLTIGGQEAVITFDGGNRSAGTISTDKGNYTFAYEADGRLNITYPDGFVYTLRNLDGAVASPIGYDAEAKGYIDGLSLSWGIESAMRSRDNRASGGPSLLLAFLLAAVGLWNLCAPKSAWWLAHGWKFKNAEPSDLALGLYRVGGGLLIFVGIICGIASL